MNEVLSNPELSGFECELLINKKSYEALRYIKGFYENKHKDDVLLLYYSGHGLKYRERDLHL